MGASPSSGRGRFGCCQHVLRPVLLASLCFSAASYGLPAGIRIVAHGAPPVADDPLEHLVFVSEDEPAHGHPRPAGCDAVSVLSLDSDEPAQLGREIQSPGRLTAASDFSVVLASNSNSGANTNGDRFLYPLLRDESTPPGTLRWDTGPPITHLRFAYMGGIAIAPDDDTVLVTTTVAGPRRPNTPPFYVTKHRLSEIRFGQTYGSLGPSYGRLRFETTPAEILITRDGRLAHIVLDSGELVTIDIATMQLAAPSVTLAPFQVAGQLPWNPPAGVAHATLSLDERYVVTNRWGIASLNIVDVISRTNRVEPLTNVALTGGIAFNRGWVNAGLLALHAADNVVVYGFSQRQLLERGRAAIESPFVGPTGASSPGGPLASIAWSGSGSHLIAATNVDTAEFQSFRVEDQGRTIVPDRLYTVCDQRPGYPNYPNDILTANGMITPPGPSPTPSPTATTTPYPTPTVSPTSTHTPSATPEPSAPPTSSLTPVATRIPVPRYLPLVLIEPGCVPERKRTDVALVIDASTSMLETTRDDRTKLAAAVEAVGLFLDELDLPHDQAAIVEFNGGVRLLQELTGNRGLLDDALVEIEVQRQTRIDLGVETAHQELLGSRRRPGNSPVMIVLTDGRANPVGPEWAVEKARLARADGITVFTIGLGEDLDEWALEAMASEPAYFYQAPDAEDLKRIYAQIAVEIPCPAGSFWGGRP